MSETNLTQLLENFLDANYYEGYTAYIIENEYCTYIEHFQHFKNLLNLEACKS